MNLEQSVAPSSINAKQWEWMKRYRVWGGQQKGVPLAGKLDRARASRRPITILQGGDERIAARGYHRGTELPRRCSTILLSSKKSPS